MCFSIALGALETTQYTRAYLIHGTAESHYLEQALPVKTKQSVFSLCWHCDLLVSYFAYSTNSLSLHLRGSVPSCSVYL